LFQEFYEFKEMIIDDCSSCNACLNKCYAFQRTRFPLFKHLGDFFENHTHVEDIKKFLDTCIYCKAHEHSCVNSSDLTLLLPAIKSDLRRLDPNYNWSPAFIPSIVSRFLRSSRFYYFWRNFNYNLIPQDFRSEYNEYRKPRKREVVFFSGCGIQLLENQYYTLCEIFKKLDVDFGLIDGSYIKPICCGSISAVTGNFQFGAYMLQNLINEVKKFGTKKVIVYCATCYWGLTSIAPELIKDFDLEIVHATGYLAEKLKSVPKGILKSPTGDQQAFTIHDSCHLAHGPCGDTTSIRNLLSQLPNSQINEMKHNKHNSMCDLYYLLIAIRNPLMLFFKNNNIPIIKEAIESEADTLCSLCPGCHAILSIFGSDIFTTLGMKKPRIPVKNWASILGENLGIFNRDMLNYRFQHLISIPFKESGIWYILQAIRALIRGGFGKKEPRPIEKILKKIRKRKKG